MEAVLLHHHADVRLCEAEELLVDGYVGLVENPGVPPPAQTYGNDLRHLALESVVHLYEVWDRAEPDAGHDTQVADWKAELEAYGGVTPASQGRPSKALAPHRLPELADREPASGGAPRLGPLARIAHEVSGPKGSEVPGGCRRGR